MKGKNIPTPLKGRPKSHVGLVCPIAESMTAAAGWTGFPLSLIARAKSSGCDAFRRHQVDIQKLVRWVAKAHKSATDLPEGFASWGDVLNQVKSDREKIRLEKDKGTALDVDEVNRAVADAEGFYWSSGERMCRELPAQLVGLTAIQAKTVVTRAWREMAEASREKFQSVKGKETK